MTRRHRAADTARLLPRPVQAVVTAALLLLVGVPVGYMLLASVNTDLSVVAGDFWPRHLTLGNYVKIWSTVELGRGLANSLVVAGAVAAASAVVALFSAYALVRRDFRGRATILRALVGLQSIPGTLLLLPVFVVFATIANRLGTQLIGTRGALFTTYLTFALPFSTWVMVTYLRGLPAEIIEAAHVDGAGNGQILLRVVTPLSWPGLVVAAVFAFLLGWNDVLFASVMTDNDTRTAAVALRIFGATQDGGAIPVYGQMMAAAIVCALPVVTLYLIFQRYLIGGLTAGGVK